MRKNVGKRLSQVGWRDLAVYLAHFTSTPRPTVDNYPASQAEKEADAIHKIKKVLNEHA